MKEWKTLLISFGFLQNCRLKKAKFRLCSTSGRQDLTYLYLYPTSILRDVDRPLDIECQTKYRTVTVRPSPLGPFSCSSSCMALRNRGVAFPSYRGSDSEVPLGNNMYAVGACISERDVLSNDINRSDGCRLKGIHRVSDGQPVTQAFSFSAGLQMWCVDKTSLARDGPVL